jgi:hypothetical protein
MRLGSRRPCTLGGRRAAAFACFRHSGPGLPRGTDRSTVCLDAVVAAAVLRTLACNALEASNPPAASRLHWSGIAIVRAWPDPALAARPKRVRVNPASRRSLLVRCGRQLSATGGARISRIAIPRTSAKARAPSSRSASRSGRAADGRRGADSLLAGVPSRGRCGLPEQLDVPRPVVDVEVRRGGVHPVEEPDRVIAVLDGAAHPLVGVC